MQYSSGKMIAAYPILIEEHAIRGGPRNYPAAGIQHDPEKRFSDCDLGHQEILRSKLDIKHD